MALFSPLRFPVCPARLQISRSRSPPYFSLFFLTIKQRRQQVRFENRRIYSGRCFKKKRFSDYFWEGVLRLWPNVHRYCDTKTNKQTNNTNVVNIPFVLNFSQRLSRLMKQMSLNSHQRKKSSATWQHQMMQKKGMLRHRNHPSKVFLKRKSAYGPTKLKNSKRKDSC